MNLSKPKLLKENKTYIIENVKQAKQYVDQGKLSKEELEKLINIDPSSTKKYVGWLSKIWINEKPDFDDLRNKIEEFNVFLNKGKTKIKDINQFKSFKDLKSEVENINNSGEGTSVKDLEKDYDIIVNNNNIVIMSPHTHEASRKLGLSVFAFRDCEGGKDSAWCTTYKAPDHFNDYYYKHHVTFYYCRAKSPEVIEKLKEAFPKKYKEMEVVALAILEDGQIDGYDGLDRQLKSNEIQTYKNILDQYE